MLANTEKSYGLLSRALHGIIMLLFFVMLGVGIYMADLDKTDELRKQLFSLHMSTGVLLFALVVVRIIWLKISPAPKLPMGLTNWEKMLTTIVKSLMYLLMLAVPIVGMLMVNSKGFPVSFYGLFDLPRLVGENDGLHEFMEEAHEFLAFSLLFLVVLHAAGALKHRFLDTGPDLDVIKRMFGKPE
jgi:cytochrome b561